MYVLSRNKKNIKSFLSENFPFLVVIFSIYLNRLVCVMKSLPCKSYGRNTHTSSSLIMFLYVVKGLKYTI